jgi:hypothetical protein
VANKAIASQSPARALRIEFFPVVHDSAWPLKNPLSHVASIDVHALTLLHRTQLVLLIAHPNLLTTPSAPDHPHPSSTKLAMPAPSPVS